MKFSSADNAFMQRALVLAEKAQYHASPNPMVGAVFVRNGKVIAEGWHARFGGLHAEAAAILSAKKHAVNLAGSILYVTLEPCVHTNKKTPPCVPAVLASGVTRVVIAMKDPNPLVAGRAVRLLKKTGMRVDVGCCHKEAERLNEVFVKWASTRVPFVAMKVAMSLDGKIATRTGDSKGKITSAESHRFVRDLRSRYDAILVGSTTVLIDNSELAGSMRDPRRILLDSTLKIPLTARVLRDKNVTVVTTSRASLSKIKMFEERGIEVKVFPRKISINPLLRWLGAQGISSVFVEGGSEVFGSFIDAKCVDRFYWFVAPKIIGGRAAKSAVGGSGVARIASALQLRSCTVRRLGSDFLFEGTW